MNKVIIIGGGPVGLSAAICLARLGIDSILIEKNQTTTDHPKARGVNGRSMELFRLWDIENKLKQYQMQKKAHGFLWLEDFQGKEHLRVTANIDYSKYSPSENAVIAQDEVEKELLNKAQSFPQTDIRFNHEMLQVFQDENKVTVEILNKNTNQKETLQAQYLIAADGTKSPVRNILDIELEGIDNLGIFANFYCEMNLDKYVSHRECAGFMFTRPEIRGSFALAKAGNRKWLIGTSLGQKPELPKETFTDDFCVDHVKKIVNDRDVEIHIINKSFWKMAALTAKQYNVGRVFLAGDAAHQLPPTGGLGMNTGIQDVHNLCWKLALVLNEEAHESLLESYFTERIQIAKTNIAFSIKNSKRFVQIFTALAQNDLNTFKTSLKEQNEHINNILLDLGFVYGKDYETKASYIPTAEPGARAPHCWLLANESLTSTINLFDNEFVLTCAPTAKHWQSKFQNFPCKIITIGKNGDYTDRDNDFLQKYEITKEGAVLIRPDGHVAWRAKDQHGKAAHLAWLK